MAASSGPLGLIEVQALEGHSDRVWCVAWSPSGNALASCSGDKTVRIWTKDGGKWTCKAILEDSHLKTIRSVDWSSCGKYLATASFDMTTGIWEHVGGEFEFLASLEGHENEVKCASWSPSGALLATCGRDKTVWVWEAQPGNEYECAAVVQGHSQDVKAVRWHPSREHLLVSASYDDSIKVWVEDGDGDDWQCVQTLAGAPSGHSSTVWGLAFDACGDRMVSCSDDLTLRVWDTSGQPCESTSGSGAGWKHLCTISGYHERTIFTVDWSRVNGLIASGAADDGIRIFAEDSEASSSGVSFQLAVHREHAHRPDVNSVRWHPKDPRLIASGGDDGVVKIWELTGDLSGLVNGRGGVDGEDV